MERRNRVLGRIARAIVTDPADRSATEAIMTIDQARAVRILDLAMRIGEWMLSVGASANDVTLATTRVALAYGMRHVHVNVTYNAITVSHHRGDDDTPPVTLARVVRAPAPDHAKLQRLQALVAEVQSGLDLEQATARFHAIRRIPFTYRPAVVVVAQGSLAVGMCILFGASWVIAAIAFVASVLAAMAQRGLARLHVPYFFSQIAGAFVVTMAAAVTVWLAQQGVPMLQDVRPGIIVAAGIVLMLAGMSVVGAAQDAIDGFMLTAGGRMLELMLLTLGVVIGITAGVALARAMGIGFDVSSEAPALGSAPLQLAGSAFVAIAVAVWNGAGLATALWSAVLGAIAWSGWFLGGQLGLETVVASGMGALLASLIGIMVAHRAHVPSIAVTTAAIVPLVPGGMVFRGLLEMVESDGSPAGLLTGAAGLAGAAAVGIALASGASLGLFLGAPLRDRVALALRGRGRLR